jgi:tetratricopeptide (TPR) repeat protein
MERNALKDGRLLRIAISVLFYTASFALCAMPCFSQVSSSQNSSTNRSHAMSPKTQDSVTVTAHYSPEEKEDWKINQVYQPIFSLEEKGQCDVAIQRYRTEVIPLAEHSQFEIPKSKFLFLANRGIGDCDLIQRDYQDAEQHYRAAMRYLPVWPGTDDSDYPITFQEIAAAQIGQQQWAAAEDSLKQSLVLFDERIAKATKSTDTFTRTEYVGDLCGSKSRSLSYLAIVYFREGYTAEALATADSAYEQSTQSHVPASFVTEVVNVGRSIAHTSGDSAAIEKWSRRIPRQ